MLVLALFATACQKDELTVVSTAVPEHACTTTVIDLDIDSLLALPPPGPGGADLFITKCDCDTVALHPVNIPMGAEFEGWIIDQGEENAHQEELDLDTLTIASELWMHFDDVWPNDGTIRIILEVAPCE